MYLEARSNQINFTEHIRDRMAFCAVFWLPTSTL